MAETAVLIDAGYLTSILQDYGSPKIDYQRFVLWASQGQTLFRAYYYDSLPYQSSVPTPDERERVAKAQKFFSALNNIDRFKIRQGRLEYRGNSDDGKPIYVQKRVDIYLALDIASLANKSRIPVLTLVAGDSDFIPAVEYAQEAGAVIRLVHGGFHSCHRELWEIVDERLEITKEVLDTLHREKKGEGVKVTK